jgi:signal transduction histidine kinase
MTGQPASSGERDGEPTGTAPGGTASALAHELSCRYVTPLLDIAIAEGRTGGLDQLVAAHRVTLAELRDESNWVSLRFCEALVEWLAGEIGAEPLAARLAEAAYSPRALGVMYPVLRAIGSPRVGFGALPQLVSRLNKVSAVRVANVQRGSAEIEYRPARPEHRERSPLICLLRRQQIAAGPTLWGLPPARVEETGCQTKGADACAYRVRWVERASWRGLLAGLAAGVVAALALHHGVATTLVALVAGGALGRLWDLGAHGRELQTFVDEHTRVLTEALDTTERRFVELEKAKAEVDARVEQRTAELKTATERRVHTEKLAVLGTLAAGLAHEVRNPANAVINGLRPVARHLTERGADPDYLESVKIAIDAGEQISRLVGDLLDVGRTDRGVEPWDPHHGIEAAIRLLSARTQRVSFERDFRFRGEILGRPPALNQIFLNLFDNAVRAAGEGGRVRVASRAEREGVEITIADSGPGVPPELAQRIFDPFFTTREVGEGTGLGLHFSRQVAYDHGGSLDLVPVPGWGACFKLWLPAHRDEAIAP